VWEQAAKTGAALGVTEVRPFLAEVVNDAKQPGDVRVAALYTLRELKDAKLNDYVAAAMAGTDAKLRAAARVVKAQANPTAAAKEIPTLLRDLSVSMVEKQTVFAAIPSIRPAKEIDTALAEWLDELMAGKVPSELKLDLLEAAQARSVAKGRDAEKAPLKDKLAAYDRQIRAGVAKDALSRWRDVTHGGDADKGRDIFVNNAAVYCQRCHKVNGQGGEVGPEITGIGTKQTRDYLLEAIVDPNKTIAKGFESVILTKEDGRIVAGVLRSKTDKEYVVVDGEGKVFKVAKDDVASERPDKSAMPDDLYKKLSRRELRDLLEFLATVK
jgi:quinoprotein glucose dehydrogenase